MMNQKKLFTGCVIFILLSACDLSFNPPGKSTDKGALIDGKEVVLSIIVQDSREAPARSVLPQYSLEDNVDRYVLRGNSGSGETELASFTGIDGASVSLETGTWNFTLNAYKGETIILRGSIQGKSIASSEDVLAFLLSPLGTGAGNIHITIEFPVGSGIVAATAVIGSDTETLAPSGSSVVYNKTGVPEGNYFVSFQLKDSGGGVIAVVSELVVVWTNLLSEKSITLEQEDLKFTVMTPTGLTITSAAKTMISLQWNALLGASGYTIYRSGTAVGPYTVAGSSDTNSYTDVELTGATTYYYRVSAVKENGVESAQSAALAGITTNLGVDAFSFADLAVAGVISGNTRTVTVPTLINISKLVPAITDSGVSVSPSPGTPQDFTSPVTYTISGENGETASYTVTVSVEDQTLEGALA
jgi:hypothetical protein